MKTAEPSKQKKPALTPEERRVREVRNQLAEILMPQEKLSFDGHDVIHISGSDESNVRLFVRERGREMYLVVTSQSGSRRYGPVLELRFDAPGFQAKLSELLKPVGIKVSKRPFNTADR